MIIIIIAAAVADDTAYGVAAADVRFIISVADCRAVIRNARDTADIFRSANSICICTIATVNDAQAFYHVHLSANTVVDTDNAAQSVSVARAAGNCGISRASLNKRF